jgi:putative membrane-bound dehydrogenase-like protein
MNTRTLLILSLAALIAAGVSSLSGQSKSKPQEIIPHGQSAPPGPPLSPQEAIKKMQVPPGFHVELVAAEPDIVNPVAMTFDERGRIWITESVEYPRRSAGPGKDRVKVLESTKGDGVYDKISTVITGLNIPSGIAVGHGGVWVANSPDILYYPIVDHDKLTFVKPQVVATGFGRDDTHELPNSLTWGPDGWLYGLNGVFNRSVVKSNNGKTYDFTCALFRIHPRTKEFQIFCEGTSNPWGIAFNENGDAFVSACVIDHLWHLVETGYYHRQGGAYPPFTWKIESIVKHKHQKAAYCGLTWFDSDAYPPEYRERLYMGNIHGSAINCDMLVKDGSTYQGKPGLRGQKTSEVSKTSEVLGQGVGEGSNFLLANDAWFMPVVQKTGPDGCLYILDWYDRYHCYQDANRDPAGIDRLRGRLYRVVYKEYKAAGKIDLAEEKIANLVDRLSNSNIYYRDTAQRVLAERLSKRNPPDEEAARIWLDAGNLLLKKDASRKSRLHLLWAFLGSDTMDIDMALTLMRHHDATFRAWGVRGFTLRSNQYANYSKQIAPFAKDPSPDVKLQVAIAARKLGDIDPIPVLLDILAHCGDDKLIPHIVWQNLHPLLASNPQGFLRALNGRAIEGNVAEMMPRIVDRLLAVKDLSPETLSGLVVSLGSGKKSAQACGKCLETLRVKIQTGELAGARLEALRKEFLPALVVMMERPDAAWSMEATFLAATFGYTESIILTYAALSERGFSEEDRLKALATLVTIRDKAALDYAAKLLGESKASSVGFRGQVLQTLGRLDDPQLAPVVLHCYAAMEADLQPKAIDLLTQRAAWSKSLLGEIAEKKIPTNALSVNQVRKLLASKDAELVRQVTKVWGTVRDGRNPEREKLVAQMRDMLKKTPGDPKAGRLHFNKICAQCHKMYGEGQDVGPDITSNGRSDFEQLLSNVFDPSLVIGAGYTATTVVTNRGQTIAGLVVEDSPQRIVLKTQGGKIETIPRGDVDQVLHSKLSLMPEDVEKQLQPQEIADLFAYLCLDRPPEDPKARKIPGTPR